MRIIVHPRIHDRHPDVTDEDVYAAWISCVKLVHRPDTEILIGAGYDIQGRLLEFTARHIQGDKDWWLIYHAMRCTRKTLKELGLESPHHKPRRPQ